MTAVNFGYFVAALPAGFATKKHSYKRTILVGLALYAAGALLFVPAASWRAYSLFLFALFVIGCGLACLETAANPYVAVLGSPAAALSDGVASAGPFAPAECADGPRWQRSWRTLEASATMVAERQVAAQDSSCFY